MRLNLCQQNLFDAAANGLSWRIEDLVGPLAPVDSEDSIGQTPLFGAARSGHRECVSFLIALGAKVNHCDRQGCTPLHEAGAAGHPGAAELLLAAGADPEITDTNGKRAKDNTIPEVRVCIHASKARRHMSKTLPSPGALR